MEPISVFTFVGVAFIAVTLKHIIDTCSTNNNNESETLINDTEIPPKYEDIDN